MKKVKIANEHFVVLPNPEVGKFCININSIRCILKNDQGSRLYTQDDSRVYDVPIPFDDLTEFLFDIED